jgi:hypothetical protein
VKCSAAVGNQKSIEHASAWSLLCCGFADWACESHETPFGQLHNSLNGGSVGHGGMELRLAPPPVADTLVPAAPLDVDTPADDRPDP